MKVVYQKQFNTVIDNEIKEIEGLAEALGNNFLDEATENGDINLLNNKAVTFEQAKDLFNKMAIDVKDSEVDKTLLMTTKEKELFFKLVKIISSIRRLFGIKA